MSQENNFQFEVWGRNALFCDPLSRGGEKLTYQVPSYQALVGIASSVYWKPSFIHVIDKVRILEPIRVESKAMRPLDKNFALNKNTLAYYTYLRNVRYQVESHIKWNLQREDLAQDRNIKKHTAIFNRALSRGGRRDVFLGTRECQAYVKPQTFGAGTGAYDEIAEQYIGMMVHGFNYPNETGDNQLSVRLWAPTMKHGVIEFEKPEDVKIVQPIREVVDYKIHDTTLFQPVDELYDEMFGGEQR
ncbi:type I-C CRISPR-associated protein Cas5c [Agrilactobacillus yilanensis]|uniref:pre-crRNA processing endonuclease n=1 Tax=Agrilactobacillus yilanensis TaxID=2485997 RepID=A0ABW4J4A8_9LACO|nr:type I-C CRISPR-associated protein Cas5c [Agrilactobacillus yilanensis]